jgi:hypothetical protein
MCFHFKVNYLPANNFITNRGVPKGSPLGRPALPFNQPFTQMARSGEKIFFYARPAGKKKTAGRKKEKSPAMADPIFAAAFKTNQFA